MENSRDRILNCLASGGRESELKVEIARMLDEVLSCPAEFDIVWHPLGFMYIKLLKSERHSLRLHIWTQEQPLYSQVMSPIHNHIWNLQSYVLCGTIINHSVQIDFKPDVYTHRIYKITYNNNLNILTPTSTLVAYKIISSARFHSGERYTVASGDFHLTETAGKRTVATLVLSEDVESVPPQSLGPIVADEYRMTRLPCDLQSIRRAVFAVKAQCR